MFDLSGKQAVITGGASGIGKAVASLFASQGATVNIVDLNSDSINAVLNEIAVDGRAVGYACDVSRQDMPAMSPDNRTLRTCIQELEKSTFS
jgi:2-keto-3-deoxy-L-fuconate dehydrogenase